jgi:hypothetical protein
MSLSVRSRRETKFTSKHAVEGIRRSKAASFRDAIERPGRRLQKPARMFEAQVQDVPGRRSTDLRSGA